MSNPTLPERALILAGGLGTRLASVLADRPKVLAPVGDRCFLDVLIDELWARGLRRFVLLLGNRHDQVREHVARRRWPDGVSFELSIEDSPLGTGGAVKLAERFCDRRFFLFNGDTYVDLDVGSLVHTHERTAAFLTVTAVRVDDAGRYGRLEASRDGIITRFREKDVSGGPGLINAGIYLIEPGLLAHIPGGRSVSLEHDTFPAALAAGKTLAVSPQNGTFFDIGTPPSYLSFVDFCRARRQDAARRGA